MTNYSWPSPNEAFDTAKHGRHRRAFKVDYIRLDMPDGGELYVTRYGWGMLERLHPEKWWNDKAYARIGERLGGSTGTVYRVPTFVEEKRLDLVVKFNRVGQHVPIMVPDTFPDEASRLNAADAQFLSPFEEFGRLMDLREGRFGPKHIKILTMRPLAVYEPPGNIPDWKSGRSSSSFHRAEHSLNANQETGLASDRIHLDIRREYVTVFQWLEGEDAESLAKRGLLTDTDLENLTRRVIDELKAKGYFVLDNKPRHFICRLDDEGQPLRHHGRLVYGLVDFELLERTDEYREWLRRRYNPWHRHAAMGSD